MTRHTWLTLARMGVRATVGAGGYLVAWRAFLAPLVAAYAVGRVVQGAVGVPWPLVAVLVVAAVVSAAASDGGRFTLQTLAARTFEAMQRSRRRTAAWSLRMRWRQTCHELGWTGATDTKPGRGGRQSAPALRLVEHLGDVVRLAWRPRGDVRPREWPRQVEALRRHLGAYSASWREDPGDPGTLVGSFGLVPLPVVDADTGTVGGQAEAPQIGRRPSAVHQVDPSPDHGEPGLRVELGQRAGGGVAAWVPAEVPHLLLVGSTGGGKGSALRYIAHQLLGEGVDLVVLDPKGTGEHRWVEVHGARVARDLPGMVEALTGAEGEMRARCADLLALGATTVRDLPPRLRPRPLVVMCDEAADLLTLRKTTGEKTADDLRQTAGTLLATLGMQGRAAAVHVVVALQRPEVAALGPAGGALRAQLAGRIVTGALDPAGLTMVFGGDADEYAPMLTGRPGRALVAGLSHTDGPTPYAVQVRWTEPARAAVHHAMHGQVVDVDPVTGEVLAAVAA